MDYVIFDLEWNQCPYGKGKENPKLPFEIIEIGAVKMDGERNVVGTFHRIVKPVVYQHLHHRTREVVGLTEEDLQMKVWIDMRLPFPYINEELIHELKILEPFGKGNGKPLFAESKLRVIQPRIFGKKTGGSAGKSDGSSLFRRSGRLSAADGKEADYVFYILSIHQ